MLLQGCAGKHTVFGRETWQLQHEISEVLTYRCSYQIGIKCSRCPTVLECIWPKGQLNGTFLMRRWVPFSLPVLPSLLYLSVWSALCPPIWSIDLVSQACSPQTERVTFFNVSCFLKWKGDSGFTPYTFIISLVCLVQHLAVCMKTCKQMKCIKIKWIFKNYYYY